MTTPNGAKRPRIAIVGYAQTQHVRRREVTEPQMILPILDGALAKAHLTRPDIGFWCSSSSDFVDGRTFSMVNNLGAVGAWPPVRQSNVEMDGAWAMQEAWIRLHEGDIDTALVYGAGKSSNSDPAVIWARTGDPYYLAPLGVDPVTMAALQARALLDAGLATERDFAEVAARSRRAAKDNPNAQVTSDATADELLQGAYVRDPLRRSDLPPISDGACAVVLATEDKARRLADEYGITPAWIAGLDHRIEPHYPGFRDLTDSASTRLAGKQAGIDGGVEVAELSALFSPQEIILRAALGLSDDVVVNPSGGPLAAHPVMATGLVRIAEAAGHIERGRSRVLAHATSGPALQQNLVCILEGER